VGVIHATVEWDTLLYLVSKGMGHMARSCERGNGTHGEIL